MKFKHLATALVLTGTMMSSAWANDDFEQKFAKLTPAEKAPFIQTMLTMLNKDIQQKYRHDPNIEKVSVQLAHQNTLVLNMTFKTDERIKQYTRSPEATSILRAKLDQEMRKTFCLKNDKDKAMFELLNITHIQTKIDMGGTQLSNRRAPLTSCQ